MNIFNSLKRVLGIAAPEKSGDTLVLTPEQKIENAEPVKPVTVKAKKSAPKTKRETRKSLEKMTKLQIDELALERFGVELDRRKTKSDMIEAFMTAQKKAK